MIFVAAGTQDGRELAGELQLAGYPVIASVVSCYGKALLETYPKIQVNDQPLNQEELETYLIEHEVKCFVDASHPYAENVSKNAMRACQRRTIPYIRYERPEIPIQYERLYRVRGYEEAAKVAATLGQHIFLTTGSRHLSVFARAKELKDKDLTIRVLPDADVIADCACLGFMPNQIIAMQGPFSETMNLEFYKKYRTEVVVTKNSGSIGGTDTKLSAAMILGLSVVMIDRPCIAYERLAEDFQTVLDFVKSQCG